MKKLSLLAAAVAVAGSGYAQALEGSLTYLSKSVDVAPVAASLVSPNTPVGAAPGSIDTTGARLSLSMGLPDIGISGKPALVLNLHHLNGDDETRIANGTGSFGMVPVDGSGGSNGGGGVNTLLFSTDVTQTGFDALLRAGIIENGPHAVAAYAGLTYSTLEQEHRFRGLTAAGTPVDGTTSLKDNLDTTYMGIVVGADYTMGLPAGFSLVAGGRVDVLDAATDLDAQQRISTSAFSRSTSDSGVVTRLEANAGIAWAQGPMRVSLVATLESMDLPTVQHPVYDSNVFPSRISDTRSESTSLTLGVGVSF